MQTSSHNTTLKRTCNWTAGAPKILILSYGSATQECIGRVRCTDKSDGYPYFQDISCTAINSTCDDATKCFTASSSLKVSMDSKFKKNIKLEDINLANPNSENKGAW
jgi:hypothetical protein